MVCRVLLLFTKLIIINMRHYICSNFPTQHCYSATTDTICQHFKLNCVFHNNIICSNLTRLILLLFLKTNQELDHKLFIIFYSLRKKKKQDYIFINDEWKNITPSGVQEHSCLH